jgi:hypothetical protein
MKKNKGSFYDYKEEEYNRETKKLHELLTQDCYDEIIKLYQNISDKEKTGEQTRNAVAA